MRPTLRQLRLWLPRAGLALAALTPAASATDLKLTARSGTQASITVAPGTPSPWSVTGKLTDNGNQGLAMFAFDLTFNGGPLVAAAAPVTTPMNNFSAPLGCSNPAGFGGTPLAGGLVQVGGAQNTIVNAFAPLPVGSVITGIAANGAPQVLASGTLTAPLQVGTYTLSIGNVMANAIRTGTTGNPFWAVDACGVGAISGLQVVVVGLTAEITTLSVQAHGSLTLSLDAGAARANRIFWLLGTIGGSSPGLPITGGLVLPLNPSIYLNFTLSNPNTILLANSLNHLDGLGKATSTFTLPHLPASLAGLHIHHAYVLLQPIDFVSNAVELTLVP